jgi:hypothetical protein
MHGERIIIPRHLLPLTAMSGASSVPGAPSFRR